MHIGEPQSSDAKPICANCADTVASDADHVDDE
jgi:hypothetical protein